MSVTAAQKGNSEDIKGLPFPLLSRSNDGFHAAQRFRLGVLGPLPLDSLKKPFSILKCDAKLYLN